MAQTRMREPVEGWTERQRQVLDLIVKGKSNSQIAEQLGLSLDGAKWHMREILSKLGVESRTEAAEYWRKRNGLPSRFARAWRGLFAAPIGKVAGAAAAVGVVGAAVVFSMVMLQSGGDEPPLEADETPPAEETPSPMQSETPEPSPGASPSPGGTPTAIVINGREIPLERPVVHEEPIRNLALLMTHGCWACDVPATAIERTWWDASGRETNEVLFDAEDRGGSYLTGIGTNADGSKIAVGLCVQAYCGPLGEYQDAARVEIWESDDYGASWQRLGTLQGQAYPLGYTQDGLVLSRFVRAGEGFDHDLLNWQTGERCVWPDWDSGSRPQPHAVETGVFWVYPDGKVLDDEFKPFFPELPGRPEVLLPGGRTSWFTWLWKAHPDAEPQLIYSRWQEDGKVASAVPLPSHTFWRPVGVAGEDWVIGSMTWPGIGQLPTIIKGPQTSPVTLDRHQVVRLREPFEALAKQNDRNVVVAAQVGPFARVNTPGECLNLRRTPNGEIIDCIADGALLTVLGADNVPALPVTFRGESGWVAFGFVQMPDAAE